MSCSLANTQRLIWNGGSCNGCTTNTGCTCRCISLQMCHRVGLLHFSSKWNLKIHEVTILHFTVWQQQIKTKAQRCRERNFGDEDDIFRYFTTWSWRLFSFCTDDVHLDVFCCLLDRTTAPHQRVGSWMVRGSNRSSRRKYIYHLTLGPIMFVYYMYNVSGGSADYVCRSTIKCLWRKCRLCLPFFKEKEIKISCDLQSHIRNLSF